jgi:hypothetical protein
LPDAAIIETTRLVENDLPSGTTNQNLGHIVNFNAPVSAFGVVGAVEQRLLN